MILLTFFMNITLHFIRFSSDFEDSCYQLWAKYFLLIFSCTNPYAHTLLMTMWWSHLHIITILLTRYITLFVIIWKYILLKLLYNSYYILLKIIVTSVKLTLLYIDYAQSYRVDTQHCWNSKHLGLVLQHPTLKNYS